MAGVAAIGSPGRVGRSRLIFGLPAGFFAAALVGVAPAELSEEEDDEEEDEEDEDEEEEESESESLCAPPDDASFLATICCAAMREPLEAEPRSRPPRLMPSLPFRCGEVGAAEADDEAGEVDVAGIGRGGVVVVAGAGGGADKTGTLIG